MYHAASQEYDYSGFGDTPILVIINPSDVLSVPKNEIGKLRTCRWFFACVLDKSEQHILNDENFDVTELGDIFEEKCLINIDDYVKNSFTEEIKRHTFNLPQINNDDVKKIIKNLKYMNEKIKNRIINI